MYDENNDIQVEVFVIPENFSGTGKILNGMVRIQNFIEGVILALPFVLIIRTMHLPLNQTIIWSIIVGGGLFFISCLGINGDSLTEFFVHFFYFKKRQRVAKYNPRVKFEAVPGYLTKEQYELPRDKLMRLLGERKNAKKGSEEISRNIYDPVYKDFFEDDVGIVDTPENLQPNKKGEIFFNRGKKKDKKSRRMKDGKEE